MSDIIGQIKGPNKINILGLSHRRLPLETAHQTFKMYFDRVK